MKHEIVITIDRGRSVTTITDEERVAHLMPYLEEPQKIYDLGIKIGKKIKEEKLRATWVAVALIEHIPVGPNGNRNVARIIGYLLDDDQKLIFSDTFIPLEAPDRIQYWSSHCLPRELTMWFPVAVVNSVMDAKRAGTAEFKPGQVYEIQCPVDSLKHVLDIKVNPND